MDSSYVDSDNEIENDNEQLQFSSIYDSAPESSIISQIIISEVLVENDASENSDSSVEYETRSYNNSSSTSSSVNTTSDSYQIIRNNIGNAPPVSFYYGNNENYTDIILKRDINILTNLFKNNYNVSMNLKTQNIYFNLLRSVIDIIYSIFRNSILIGDIVSDIFLFENRKNINISLENYKYNELIFLVNDFDISFETVISMISIMSKSVLNYYFSSIIANLLRIDFKDSENNIYTINIQIVNINNLYINDNKSKSPYDLKSKVYLNLNTEKLYYLTLHLLRFKHQKLALIKNGIINEFVIFDTDDIHGKYYIDVLNQKYSEYLIDMKLEFCDILLNPKREIEYYLKYDFEKKTKQSIVLTRLNMYIQINIILQYISKNWKYNNIHKISFNDKCYICYNEPSDIEKDFTIYKIAYDCCKESSNGICINCFINNLKNCLLEYKSSFICPFCKKSNIFYNPELCAAVNIE